MTSCGGKTTTRILSKKPPRKSFEIAISPRLLFETFECVDDVFDTRPLLVDRTGARDRRHHGWNDDCDHQRDRGNTDELLHGGQPYRI